MKKYIQLNSRPIEDINSVIDGYEGLGKLSWCENDKFNQTKTLLKRLNECDGIFFNPSNKSKRNLFLKSLNIFDNECRYLTYALLDAGFWVVIDRYGDLVRTSAEIDQSVLNTVYKMSLLYDIPDNSKPICNCKIVEPRVLSEGTLDSLPEEITRNIHKPTVERITALMKSLDFMKRTGKIIETDVWHPTHKIRRDDLINYFEKYVSWYDLYLAISCSGYPLAIHGFHNEIVTKLKFV